MRGVTLATYRAWCAEKRLPTPDAAALRAIPDVHVAAIYYERYWEPSGAAALAWPDALALFDLAVNGGVGRAKEFAAEVGTDALALTERRLRWYTNLDGWATFGRGWVRRCAALLREL